MSTDEAVENEARDWIRRCGPHYAGQEARLMAAFAAGAALDSEQRVSELREALQDAYKWLKRARGAVLHYWTLERAEQYTEACKRAAEALDQTEGK